MFFALLLYYESVMISSLTNNVFIHLIFHAKFTLNIKSVVLKIWYGMTPISVK